MNLLNIFFIIFLIIKSMENKSEAKEQTVKGRGISYLVGLLGDKQVGKTHIAHMLTGK